MAIRGCTPERKDGRQEVTRSGLSAFRSQLFVVDYLLQEPDDEGKGFGHNRRRPRQGNRLVPEEARRGGCKIGEANSEAVKCLRGNRQERLGDDQEGKGS